MCKSSKLFLSCFVVSLFSVSPFVNAKSDNSVVTNQNKAVLESDSDQNEEDFDVSSLSGSQINEMVKPFLDELRGFFETIFELKNGLKSHSDNAKAISTYLESCKFTFIKEKNCFIVSVYPPNINPEEYFLDRVVTFNLDSKCKIAFNLARKKSVDKSTVEQSANEADKNNKSDDKNKTQEPFLDITSLSNEKIIEKGQPYANVIRMLFGIVDEFRTGLIKISKKNEKIINYLESCKVVLEKDNSSSKSDSFNFSIYAYDGPDAIVDPIGKIEMGENSSINFNFIKKK